MNRSEAFEEYFRLAGFVQAYDPYMLSIKSWGVTVSAAAIGAGFTPTVASSSLRQAAVFGVALLLAGSFWLFEVMFKLLQLAHVYRLAELERALAVDEEIPGPAILTSFSNGRAIDRVRKRWRSVLCFPHVALPHVIFVAASSILLILALAGGLH